MKNKESKREKFVRIAEARTNKIINMIQLLGNCSNQSLYEYSQKDVNKIFNTLQTELDEAKKGTVSRIVLKEVNLHLNKGRKLLCFNGMININGFFLI